MGGRRSLATGPGGKDVGGGVDAHLRDLAVENQFHVAGALELLEDNLVHPAARSIRAVAMIVSEPASRVLRAAAKSLRGVSSALMSRPPLPVRPPPLIALLNARPIRVIESSTMKTSSPISTRRLARSIASCAIRV